MFHARTAERPTRPVGQAAKTPPSHGGNGGSIPPRVRKKHAEACFFQRNKSAARICEIRSAREIRLRRVKCLRAWVDLFHFAFGASRIFHIFRQENISHPAERDISLKNRRGDPSVFHLFSSPFSLLSSLKKPRRSEVFSSNPSLQAAPICDILYNVRKHTGLSGRAERQIQPPPARTREVRTYFL